MAEMNVKKTITLDAQYNKVWEALTKPEIIKKYMFGTEVVSEWKVGSPILWIGNSDGVDKIRMKGAIEKIEVGRLIQFSTLNMDASYTDVPSNYVKATYELIPKLGKTQLSVTQGDFSRVQDGRKRFIQADGGLNKTLSALKTFIETNHK